MKYTVDVITFCYNEMPILPWVVDYWKRFVRHVYVFDNGSTDGSVEYLKSFDFITVMNTSYMTGDKLSDLFNMWVKNSLYKMLDSDFSYICDMDECLWCDDIEGFLDRFRNSKYKAVQPFYCHMICESTPQYQEGKLFHEYNKWCVPWDPKCLLFDNTKIDEIYFTPGAHEARALKWTEVYTYPIGVYCFHLRYLSLDYMIKRRDMYSVRLSELNKKMTWGAHLQYTDERLKQDYDDMWSKKIEWDSFI